MLFFWSYLILIFFNFLIPTTDTDFGWHYRCGQEFISQGQLCVNNRFSYFLSQYQWGYSSFIYDVLLAGIYDWFGFWGVAVALAILVTLIVAIFYLAFRLSPTVFLSVGLFLLGSANIITIGFRPQVLSLLFFLFLLLLIKHLNSKRSRTIAINLIIICLLVLWTNSHPSFILGIGVYLLYSFWQVFKGQRLYLLMIFFGLCLPLINPLGVGVYTEIWHHYQTDLSKLIAEWTAPNRIMQGAMLVTYLTVFYVLIFKYKHRHELSIFYLVILSILLIIAFDAKRHVPLYWLLFFFILEHSEVLANALKHLKIPISLFNVSLISLLFFMALVNVQKLVPINNFKQWYCSHALVKLPYTQIEKYRKFKGNIFTMYEWGGYFIWQIPGSRVFVDGRMPAWITKSGKSPYTIYLEIIQAQPGWEKTLANYQTDLIFIKSGTFLDLELQENPRSQWLSRYHDSQVAIYQIKK
ncbi:hypothetical protein A2209_01930 [Candidatus Roizmanbacteria bacterium RIFOXYA1_FULL_41_12]|uniref:Glycosyltransferase RgtA/B/C/D-like domain-containing protein n=1 Tax=Candidatus Roizmanbacteria bacterium RIFOXYA1_FULL_41_12 TaxID=1802082 RepID=A0A1F7KEJ9_9BACT|nr:MAG: hypothetical protein A2209_01930 [Candidatus Roizmanbacteria bacterium RIFOXYA1_FULL_41_12]OGK70684.1 MAG: hypothetical protein A2403_01150 [Candidatus Roizmanbacteria bacterium RIFOXYC1_FULL_41_16]OGK75072.1 MAG: hypothetical protein A2459_02635 [Candidatus Roizmanbacteria bacterium RIFOXYC2_FULL_41_10]